VERDRLGQHQLVVAFVVGEGGEGERRRRQQLGVAGGDPARRVLQVLRRRVLPERGQQIGHRALGPGQIHPGIIGDDVQVGTSPRRLPPRLRSGDGGHLGPSCRHWRMLRSNGGTVAMTTASSSYDLYYQ
jgi:hypothetical protein